MSNTAHAKINIKTRYNTTFSKSLMTMTPTALLDIQYIDQQQPPFILVDGSYYLFRTFHALPTMTTTKGLHTNAIRGTLNALKKLINRYQPTHMVVAFDTKEPTFRHELSEFYKANRPEMPNELAQQIPYIHQLIKVLGIPLIMIDGWEADDIIGTLAHKACLAGHHVVISTGDKDMCQLVNKAIILEDSFTGKITDVAGVQEKFGIEPRQMIDFLTLMGDSSDGIKGITGIGKVKAKQLLNEFDSIDNLLQNLDKLKGKLKQNLEENQHEIPLNRKLATIVTDVDIVTNWQDFQINTDPTAFFTEQKALFSELEFKAELASLSHPNHPANVKLFSKNFSEVQNKPATLNHTFDDKNINNHTQANQQNDNQTVKTPLVKQWRTIQEIAEFDQLILQLQNARYFVIDTETTSLNWQRASLVGLAFALQAEQAFYIPLAHVDDFGQLLPNQLPLEMVLQKLKPILENQHIGKIGQHLKYDAHILKKYDINLNISAKNWAMDTMLASYVWNTVATSHSMDSLAQYYLNKSTITFETVAGKGAKQISFDKVSINIASDYACEDADITFQLFDYFKDKLNENDKKLLHELEIPIAQILTQMENDGILIQREFLTELSVQFDEQIQQLEQLAHQQAGEVFNLASPKQLGEILFEKLKLDGGKKTKTGQYSTSEMVLAKINHEIIDTILEYRSLSKLKSTYTDALNQVADVNNRVHTSYHQALTSTGRLSSVEPNLQNIPIRSKTGRLIRQAFIAPAGRVIMSADYSQIELRLMAHFAKDPILIEAFNQGHDIHRATASEVLAKPFDQVTTEERRRAKAINFGLLYGMSEFGLAKQLQLSKEEAQQYIQQYFSKYPNVKNYMQNIRKVAYEQGYVETILGRKLHTPDLHNSNRMIRQASERAAINAPLQGSASDIIKLAMIAVDEILPKQSAKMLLQVHDELVFEVDSEQVEPIAQLIKTAMQQVLTHTAKQKGWQVDFAVPLVVDVGIGENWDKAH